MKTLKTAATALTIGMLLNLTNPLSAQTVQKDTTATTKPNGSGAGNGVSQGAPGAATVSGTGTGTLADSNALPAGDSGVKKTALINDLKTGNEHAGSGRNNWGLLGLVGLLGLLGLKKKSNSQVS